MRFATTASVVILALSTAALAQVGAAPQHMMGNDMMMPNASGPGNAPMPAPTATPPMADNMMDNSAAPPPDEPK